MIAIAASAVLAGSAAVAQTAPATPPAATAPAPCAVRPVPAAAPQPPPAPPPAATAPAPYYNAEDSTMGDLLDSPEAKAVLVKHVPDLLKNEGIERARGMTLASLQQYAAEIL